jgi:glyoxylase-like metal-dependent hydrolase (beta-lactamase superfamily II)
MQQVGKGIFQLSGWWDQADLGANVYLLALEGSKVLVDAGFKGKAVEILRRVHSLGFNAARIGHIIVTHHHPDHVGGLALLVRLTGARVVAHGYDAPYIDGRLAQPGPCRPAWLKSAAAPIKGMLATPPIRVDIEVKDGDELPLAGGMRVLHTPGHTPGSICLELKNEGMVFTGDLLAQRFGLKLPSLPFTEDIGQLKSSVKKLAGREFKTACFGHGSPIRHDAGRRVAAFAKKLK